jgi:hypothetical protein
MRYALFVSEIGQPVSEKWLASMRVVDLTGTGNPSASAAELFVRKALNLIKGQQAVGEITWRERTDLQARMLDFRAGFMEYFVVGECVCLQVGQLEITCMRVPS